MSSIRDVAKAAGVSIATVSRVVNDGGGVSAATRDRVLGVVAELGYRPNRLAASLRGRTSNLVALFLDNHKSPFATMLYSAVEEVMQSEGFQLLTCCTRSSSEHERSYVQAMVEMRAAGAIVRPTTSMTETIRNIRRMHSHDMQTVYIDMAVGSRRSDHFVICDNLGGGRLGMEHLVAQGHRHVGVVATRNDQDARHERSASLRLRGLLEVARDHGIEGNIHLAPPTDLSRYELGYENATALLRQHPEITAIFALTDTSAIGAMHAVMDLGLSIPDDISILGYDGLPLGETLVPPLTTVAQPIADMGAEAARTLIAAIRDPDMQPRQLVLPVKLCERSSVSHPRRTPILSI